MKLTLHLEAGLPGQPETTISVNGDVVTHNGTEYDLSSVPEGGRAIPEGEHPFYGFITRVNGEPVAEMRWQFDPTTAEPDQGFELPVVQITNGDVPDPVKRLPEPEPEPEPEDPQAEEGEPA